jgi:hypothetical protein
MVGHAGPGETLRSPWLLLVIRPFDRTACWLVSLPSFVEVLDGLRRVFFVAILKTGKVLLLSGKFHDQADNVEK